MSFVRSFLGGRRIGNFVQSARGALQILPPEPRRPNLSLNRRSWRTSDVRLFYVYSRSLQMNKNRFQMMYDTAVPNDKWSKESVELFNKLNGLGGDWKIHYRSIFEGLDGSRHFPSAVKDEPWKLFQYAFFHNAKLQCIKAVVQYGLYTRGPIGLVHGGAMATILDVVMGNCVYYCGHNSVTGNLNIEYKRPIPLNATTLVEARIDKIEGRKVFLSGEIKSADGSEIYSRGTTIFIMLKSSM